MTAEQKESDLLFPAITGGFRSPSVLNKPFGKVSEAIGLGKRFSQRGLRRTFNDLARAAHIEGVITKSISGHLTDKMRERYSTVGAVEQRASIAKVIDFAQSKAAKAVERGGEESGEERPASGEEETKTG